jgi:glutamate synthase (NADPH/NADH) small chain
MGDPRGFLTVKRRLSDYRPVEERINDYSEVETRLEDSDRQAQASRCMDCGVPFCHWSCPLGNVMPEWQDKLYRGDWAGAWAVLQQTNPFPEFTGRVCPALCEASCVLGRNDEPVTIRQNELAVIEKAWDLGLVVPRPPKKRNGKKVAVVGAGPAGLSCAYFLNRAGFTVTVYEADKQVGGYLRYGIPNFKLDKRFLDRRVKLMEAEGITFKTNTRVGSGHFAFGTAGGGAEIIDAKSLEADHDLILITIGAREARDLKAPGRELGGIMQALDFLSLQNRNLAHEKIDREFGGSPGDEGAFAMGNAYGKRVVVIGGGDTGSDCVGTANRQGAVSVTQIEVMPKPPLHRVESAPWPLWPTLLKTSSSHEEGAERLWSINTKEFIGNKEGNVSAIHVNTCEWQVKDGKRVMVEVPGTDKELGADLVLLAMGFVHVVQKGLVEDLGLELDARGNIRTHGTFHTSNPKVWAAGDARNGASLVVRAITEGRTAAEAIMKTL